MYICTVYPMVQSLVFSIFEFDKKIYKQQFGTSMGSRPAPPYANLFMAKNIDEQIRKIAEKYQENGEIPLKSMKRFLDDIFLIFIGTIQNLHKFFQEINTIHPQIKFTMSHTTPKAEQDLPPSCSCKPTESIPYLDTSCQIKQGKIVTDLYRKPTDKNQYLLNSSCNPPECLQSIPFSLSMRINRICCEDETREKPFQEMKEMLINREYPKGVIDGAIAKARAIPRQEALRRVPRQHTTSRPTFVVSYDPRLPSISNITRKHWRAMNNQDDYLGSVFPEPPIVSYSRQKNIGESKIRAKVAAQRQHRIQRGMKK